MCCLAPLCRLAILMLLHCVYAQYLQPMPFALDNLRLFRLYNPNNGEPLVPLGRINDNVVELPTIRWPCSCGQGSCKCCLGIGFGITRNVLCSVIKYTRQDLSVYFAVELNQRQVAGFKITPNDIPDLCTVLPIPISACLQLRRAYTDDQNLYICISLILKGLINKLAEYKLSCFQIGISQASIVESNWEMEIRQPNNQQQQMLAPSSYRQSQISMQ